MSVIAVIIVDCLALSAGYNSRLVFGFIAAFDFERIHAEVQQIRQARQQAHIFGVKHIAAVFVFDEPTIGLHPLDVQTLLAVFQRLVEAGATVVVIEHDLDVIRNADYVIDMGPGGGEEGGRIVCAGTPEEIAACPDSVTGRYL